MRRFGALAVRSVRTAGWAPLAVFALHAVFFFRGTYGRVPSLDIPMHFGGGLAIAYFFACVATLAAEQGVLGRPNRLALALLVAFATCGAAIAWEFAEWGYDRFFAARDARGYLDTLLDLALGVLGGGVFAAAWWRAGPA